MTEEPFEKMDESLREEFRAFREKKVPSDILIGFSASVAEKIRARAGEKESRRVRFPIWIPALVPVLGVLALFVWAAVLKPSPGMRTVLLPNGSVPIALSVTHDLSEEIAALEELGAWTEEDDRSVDTSLSD